MPPVRSGAAAAGSRAAGWPGGASSSTTPAGLDGRTPQSASQARLTDTIRSSTQVLLQVVNDLPLGRNVDEALRMVDALQFHEEHGEVCPAGWNRGDEGMDASAEGVAKYLKGNAKKL